MKSFIAPDELARDSRFVRQKNRLGDLMLKLPDDLDTVVDVFESITGEIEQTARGTAAEPLFDEYGAGFMLISLAKGLDPADPVAHTRLLMRMHGIYVGELQALEGAGRSLWDFPDAPWEFKMNMARQVWDESRHVQIYEKLLDHVGGAPGMFPEDTFLFECACSPDPAMRVAGVNRGLEGLACDVFRDMIKYAQRIGDEVMEQAIDYVLADEITHVRFGSEWVKKFTEGDPEYFKKTQDYRREVDRMFSFGGARSDREDAPFPIAWEDRREAGFTDEELDDLSKISVEGLSAETVNAAVVVLHDRHQARKAKAQKNAQEARA